MRTHFRIAMTTAGLLWCMTSALAQPPASSTARDEKAFLSANDKVMNNMMNGMMATPSGDVDHDFVSMMVPHHQGAMDMAQLELLYGHNEQLRRIAQEIIVEQQQEIVAMRVALGQPLPAALAAPDQILPTLPAAVLDTTHSQQDHK